ncbi:hypothetical protein [Aquimarina macrocephali]|uniref:hypothetical protein n=1 Tax=Aquimarina macrocephali TaxID=666563 RepID=UPI0004679CC9|nr:hypothetical protein [Aquimarina macrocephali]
MKRIKLIQALCIICILLFTSSCENEAESTQEVLLETNDGEFAVFTFANGNKLQLIKGDEEGDPIIIAMESGPENNKTFIDFDTHSMLDIYLGLTSEEYPIPQILMDLSKSAKNQKLLEKRKVVYTLNTPVTIEMTKIPESLLQKHPANRGFCDDVSADFCHPGEWMRRNEVTSSSRKRIVQIFSQVFSDTNSKTKGMNVQSRYKNSSGSWRIIFKTAHTIKRGYWKRITYPGVSKRIRKVIRRPHNDDYPIHWRGWVDYRN